MFSQRAKFWAFSVGFVVLALSLLGLLIFMQIPASNTPMFDTNLSEELRSPNVPRYIDFIVGSAILAGLIMVSIDIWNYTGSFEMSDPKDHIPHGWYCGLFTGIFGSLAFITWAGLFGAMFVSPVFTVLMSWYYLKKHKVSNFKSIFAFAAGMFLATWCLSTFLSGATQGLAYAVLCLVFSVTVITLADGLFLDRFAANAEKTIEHDAEFNCQLDDFRFYSDEHGNDEPLS